MPYSHNLKPMIKNKTYVLRKFEGKSGWTYIHIPEISPDKNSPFGWVTVSGSIDDYPLRKVKLMPKGDGTLFLAVKSIIRKKIKKEAGDDVVVSLYTDRTPLEIPEEILLCFQNESQNKYNNFLNLPDSQKKTYLDWIYDARTDSTKVKRIIAMMDRLEKNLKLHDEENSENTRAF